MVRHLIAGLAGVFLTVSCAPSGGQAPALGPGLLPSAVSSVDATAGTGTVKVTVTIPKKVFPRSHYVSSATQSIVIKAYSAHRKLLLTKKQNLLAGSKGCKTTTNARICTFAFRVAAGKDRFQAVTYDRPNGKGNELSGKLSFVHRVKAGKATKLPLALAGIARSLLWQVFDDEYSSYVTGSSTSGFLFAGLFDHTMQIFPLDADQNIILGPGAPKLSLASGNTADVDVVSVAGNTNEFLLRPHQGASGVHLTASATFLGETIKSTATLSILSLLYVANYGNTNPSGSVTVYVPWSDAPVETITNGVNNAAVLTVDSLGNLWVGNDAGGATGAGSITEYRPGSSTPERTITGITNPSSSGRALAVDGSGNLYCACNHAHEVDEFTPAGGSTPSRSLTSASSPTGISTPISVVTDSSGDVYVANLGSDSVGVSVFNPGSGTTPLRNITSGIHGASQLAMDRLGNLYVGNSLANPVTITEYAPNSSAVAKTFDYNGDSTQISGLAVDRSGNVYMGDSESSVNSVLIRFSPTSPAYGSRTVVISDGFIYATAVDPAGNAYVPLSDSSRVFVYPPGTSTTASRTLTNGIDQPWDVVAWPN